MLDAWALSLQTVSLHLQILGKKEKINKRVRTWVGSKSGENENVNTYFIKYTCKTLYITGKNGSSKCQTDDILSLLTSPEHSGNNVVTLSKKTRQIKNKEQIIRGYLFVI